MSEKYNEKITKIKLAEIKADQPPEFLMTKEQFQEAIMNNLPKQTVCPNHERLMELSEGISKKGEPYRLYKCPINGCEQKIWTERESDIINAEVKDIESMLGIKKLPATPAEGLEKKQKGIEKNIIRKENSIIEAAIRRDSVMFAVAEMNADYLEKGKTAEQRLKELHEKWLAYFKDIYV